MPRTQSFCRSRSIIRPLTPVSEADSDETETTDSTINRHASSSTTSSGRNSTNGYIDSLPRSVNFSLPQNYVDTIPSRSRNARHQQKSIANLPMGTPSIHSPGKRRDDSGGYPFPVQPCLSRDDKHKLSRRTRTTTDTGGDLGATNPAFKWETHLRDMRPISLRRTVEEEQRDEVKAKPDCEKSRQPNVDMKHSSGLQISTQQQNSYAAAEDNEDEADWSGEDARSRHTVSDDGDDYDNHIADNSVPWQSSTFDVSRMKEKQLKKLRKKGISPALYLEMKAARDGRRKWINPLVGNTYLS